MKALKYVPVVLACLCGYPCANADVIIDDAELKYFDADSDILITTNTVGGLGILVSDMGGGNYDFSYHLIANEYGLYSAYPGLEFIPSYADAETPIVSNNGIDPGLSLQTFSLNETKYYAYWEDIFGPNIGIDSTDNYGWVGLKYTGTELIVTNSATALGGGIIVGTYTQIPEPSSALLLAFGSGGILFYRRAKRRQQEHRIS